MRCHAFLTAAIALALAHVAPTVRAQDTPDNTPAAQQGAHAPSWTLAPVQVTAKRATYAASAGTAATRTDTPFIEVPQSVQAITRSLLVEQDRRQLADALVNVSGVVPNKADEGVLSGPLVRGFMAEIYQDGLPMYGATQAMNDPVSLVGVQRIEVLKGPSSALYGGGVGSPLGGLIDIVSEQPDVDRAGGDVGLRFGRYGTVNPYANVNLPIGTRIAARVAAEYQDSDSWIDRVHGKRWTLQPSLAWAPTPQTDLLLQAQFSRRAMLEYSGLPAALALAGRLDRDGFAGAPVGQPQTELRSRMVTATLRHAFTDQTRAQVAARYYRNEVPQYGSFIYPQLYPADPATPTVFPILPINMLSRVQERTFDAHVLTSGEWLGGRHRLLFGINYDHTDFYTGMSALGGPVGTIDLAHPRDDLVFGALQPLLLTQRDRYQTIAAYAQDQATYGRLHLTAALRFTQLAFREAEQATDRTYHRGSPRLGATFDIAPGFAVYAGYTTAFRAPYGLVSLAPAKLERSRNVEAGLKWALADTGLSATLAAFEQTRENVATPDPDNPVYYSVQSGRQRARGVEADLVWEPTPAFSLLANVAYTQAQVTQDNLIPVGDALPRVPRRNGRVAARYRFLDGAAKGLSFGAGVSALSARELTLPNTVAVPGYAMIDAQVSYEVSRYTFALSVVNLAGRTVYDTYQYLGFPVVMPAPPRSAYATFKVHF